MIYTIKGWETEECREEGLSFELEDFDTLQEAIDEADAYYRNDLACVEVEDEEGRVYYHNSEDGESYYIFDGDTNKMVEINNINK